MCQVIFTKQDLWLLHKPKGPGTVALLFAPSGNKTPMTVKSLPERAH